MEKKVTTLPIATMPNAQAPMAQMPAATAPVTQPMEKHEMKKWCKEHMHRYVLVHTKDGWCCDGFVEHIDDENVIIAVPHSDAGSSPRGFFPQPGFFPYPPLYPYPYYPRRRFYRQVFPLVALLGLSLLPFF
ncbi:hypothetical protein [Paenibacillus nasutitermitis]|uniref:Uncharacterized protein n=1 Tax=Paenibacillus nasutitermitis TaxID=1652958 RepID=A0A917DUF9_9BACL|nr:hypothetical protein [Paenibacillus nasutitermitis]GGD71472.1 hypothetical protein GCM10010911_31760 [Paenibacillus nasutitermitis]